MNAGILFISVSMMHHPHSWGVRHVEDPTGVLSFKNIASPSLSAWLLWNVVFRMLFATQLLR